MRELTRKRQAFLKVCLMILIGLPSLGYSLAPVETREPPPREFEQTVQTDLNFDPMAGETETAPSSNTIDITPPSRGQNIDSASTKISRQSNTTPSTFKSDQQRAAMLTLSEVEGLKREVQELRGLIETQQHELKQIKKSQQDLFIDLERRFLGVQGKDKTPGVSIPTPKSGAITKASPSESKSVQSVQPPSQPDPQNMISKDAVPKEQATHTDNKSNENESFQAAYQLLRTKRYEEAILALNTHLKRFAKGEQAPNALYWLGEIYMVQWQGDKNKTQALTNAQDAFNKLLFEFPRHTKAGDAMLKLGLIELEQDHLDLAKKLLGEVKSRYPGTSAARIAETKLKSLG